MMAQQYARQQPAGTSDRNWQDHTTRPGMHQAPISAPSRQMTGMSLGAGAGAGGLAAPGTVLNPSGIRSIGSRDVSKVR
jgi:hypothetical protein